MFIESVIGGFIESFIKACMEGFMVTTIDDIVEEIDIFVTATGNKDVIRLNHMRDRGDV